MMAKVESFKDAYGAVDGPDFSNVSRGSAEVVAVEFPSQKACELCGDDPRVAASLPAEEWRSLQKAVESELSEKVQ